MNDRFGPVPIEVDNLLITMEMKILGRALRLTRVVFKNQRLFLILPEPTQDLYFYKSRYKAFLTDLKALDRKHVLKENRAGKLRAIVQEVSDLEAARDILKELVQNIPVVKEDENDA